MIDNIKILDCTLRDGGYVNNYQFTADQTKQIVMGLDAANIPYIETGHAQGVGAMKKGLGDAAESDEVYMKVAAESTNQSKWGMLYLTNVSSLEDIDMGADHEIDFIRVGVEVDDIKSLFPFVDRIKKHNIYMCCNILKSHKITSDKFCEISKEVTNRGGDCMYIVDSTGGMLPNEVSEYAKKVKDSLPDVTLGFHGHDNLGLSSYNSLSAISAGVEIVDTTLRGLGRSAGNTQTERFVCTLKRLGYTTGIDIAKLFDVSDVSIYPLAKHIDSLDTILGATKTHSGSVSSDDTDTIDTLLGTFLND